MTVNEGNGDTMRVVHFAWEFPPRVIGGLGTFASELTRHMVRMGHEMTVMTMNAGNEYTTVDNWKGVEVHRPMIVDISDILPIFSDNELRNWGSDIKFFSDVLAYNVMTTAKFVNYIYRKEGRKYNLIHAHDWLGIIGGLATKRETGLPLIFHVHSTEKGRSRGLGSRTVEAMEFTGGAKANRVVTVSNAMKQEIITLGLAPKEKISVCWNGVDTKKYDPDTVSPEDVEKLKYRYNIVYGEKVILFVGRLVSVKGVNKLIDAMPAVLAQNPDSKLVVLGTGGLEEQLKDRVKKLGLEDHVVFRFEFVSEKERIVHYAMADLCVFPSTYEPFGIVCTEAMAMGKPVVVGASGTNGMAEQVVPDGPGKCGIHVNGNDPRDIAWGINQALSSDDDMRLMGANARKRAIELFDWDKISGRMVNIYRECIEETCG